MSCSMQSGLSLVGVSYSAMFDVSKDGGKYGRRQSTFEHWEHAKEWGNHELTSVVTNSLGDGVKNISEWSDVPMGSDKAFFLQMKPDFCRPFETCVVPDADHAAPSTWHFPECSDDISTCWVKVL